MSFQAMADVIRLNVDNSTAKFILIMVANYADEHGQAWPSIARLVADTCTSERTVQRALAWLEAKGFIERESRCHLGQPDVLTLRTVFTPRHNGTPHPPPICPKPPVKLTPKPIIEPIKERPPISPPLGDNVSDGYPGDFERLWQSFPRNPNSSKQLAFIRWKKLSQSDREDCEDTTPLYKAELEKLKPTKDGRKPVMHLSTYISRAMWENYINGQVQENPGLFGHGPGRHHSH